MVRTKKNEKNKQIAGQREEKAKRKQVRKRGRKHNEKSFASNSENHFLFVCSASLFRLQPRKGHK